MSASKLKLLAVATGVVLGALVLLSWSQTWFVVRLAESVSTDHAIAVGGDVAAPALAALGLAGLALVGALSIAGPIVRVILGVLETTIGFCVMLSAAVAVLGPVDASSSSVTKATGVSGADSIAALISEVTTTAWPFLALLLGAAACALGVAIIVTSRRWPQATRRYQAARFEPDTPSDAAMTNWDALSDGTDPTSR